jgi:hypothetical protein
MMELPHFVSMLSSGESYLYSPRRPRTFFKRNGLRIMDIFEVHLWQYFGRQLIMSFEIVSSWESINVMNKIEIGKRFNRLPV